MLESLGARVVPPPSVASRAAAAGDPLYLVDRDALAALRPDIVVSQSICDVCAARTDACDLPPGARLLELAATDLAGLEHDLRSLAAAADRRDRAEARISELQKRLDEIATAPEEKALLDQVAQARSAYVSLRKEQTAAHETAALDAGALGKLREAIGLYDQRQQAGKK